MSCIKYINSDHKKLQCNNYNIPWCRAGQVVVEAGDQLLPGGGVELLRADLPLTEEFNKNLQRTHLETLR